MTYAEMLAAANTQWEASFRQIAAEYSARKRALASKPLKDRISPAGYADAAKTEADNKAAMDAAYAAYYAAINADTTPEPTPDTDHCPHGNPEHDFCPICDLQPGLVIDEETGEPVPVADSKPTDFYWHDMPHTDRVYHASPNSQGYRCNVPVASIKRDGDAYVVTRYEGRWMADTADEALYTFLSTYDPSGIVSTYRR